MSPSPLLLPETGRRLCGGDPALYQRMLGRFPSDPSVRLLEAALNSGDASHAFLHAHTLKGLCAQLALPALGEKAAGLCSLLSAQQTCSLTGARELSSQLLAVYRDTLDAIARHLSANS